MAWNRPAEKVAVSQPKKPKVNGIARGVMAGLFVVIGVFAAWFFLRPSADGPTEPRGRKAGRIAAKDPVRIAKDQPQALKEHPNEKWTPDLKLERTKDVKPPELTQREILLAELNRKFFGEPLFKHDSENFISGVLTAVPGDRFLTDDVSSGFDKDFAASLKDKIEILPDDSEDVIAQKKAVIAAKESLAKCLEKGQSPADVMSDLMKDLNEVADYRDKLKENVNLILKEGTEEDVRLYVEESNRNLAQYDARPIVVSDFQYELLRRRIAKRQAEAAPQSEVQKEEERK